MRRTESFIEGPILGLLLRFTFPILLALLLQAMYGAVDLMVVGWFGLCPGMCPPCPPAAR